MKNLRNCFDKSVTKEIVMNQEFYLQNIIKLLQIHAMIILISSLKIFVKPNSQGSSVGFNVIDNFENL